LLLPRFINPLNVFSKGESRGNSLGRKKMRGPIAGILTAVALGTTAHGFEVYGFRSGMTLAAVRELVRARGEELVPISGLTKIEAFFVERKGSKDWGPHLSFCQGRLFALNQNIQGGFEAFTRTASDLQNNLTPSGNKATSTYGPNGLLSMIELNYIADPNETQSISMTQFQDKISVTQGWHAQDLSAACR
jgi:hypothetical protein